MNSNQTKPMQSFGTKSAVIYAVTKDFKTDKVSSLSGNITFKKVNLIP